MNNRKVRLARLRSVSSESRSRSATPMNEERHHHQPVARRALISEIINMSEVRDPELSPPRKIRAIGVECTPRGSINVKEPEVILQKTPGGSIRKLTEQVRDNVVERVEAMDISDGEIEELLQTNPGHITRWIPEIRPPNIEVSSASEPRPSTSGVTTQGQGIVYNYESDGSGFDSDWDDEFEQTSVEAPAMIQVQRDIPDDAELDAPIRTIIADVERGMDDEADRLLGTSPNFVWREDFESFRGVPEQFSGPTPGPLKDYDSAYDAFVDIWDKDIIDRIVCETNRYAQQTIEKLKAKGTLTRSSRLHRWDPTSVDEIMVLFAIFQFMAIDPRTSQDEYWKKGVLGMSVFRTLMSYNRFILLNKFLHFVDNSDPGRDMPRSGAIGSTKVLSRRLSKLAPIIAHLGYKFDSLYQLKPHISIDESLTLFKGRLSWVQTIRSKAARFGIKSYELCESHSGYMARFQIYTGKTDEVLIDSEISADLGLKSTKTVLELLQGLEHRGHCVTMDNFYNCPSLARYLKSLGFDCLGTLRTNRRYVPKEISKVPANVPKGTIIPRHSGDVSIVSWKDSKLVTLISTYHNADTYVGSRAGKRAVKPVCVRDYNKYMGGIDLKDQKLSMYLLERKRGVKWYMKLFKRLMNVSILNSMVMYACCRERHEQVPLTHREFRYSLAESLIEKHGSSRKEIQEPVGELMRLRRDIVHDPSHHPGANNRRRCRVCYARTKTTKYSHFRCVPCDVFLCLGNCWKEWHTLQELRTQGERGRRRVQ